MYPVLVLILALSLPALADGCGAIISFWLSGGPAIPIIAILLVSRLSRGHLKDRSRVVIAFLLSIPSALIGFRASFEFLMGQDDFLMNASLFFGPLVLLSSLYLAGLPAVLLCLPPIRSTETDTDEPFGLKLARKLPVVAILAVSLALSFLSFKKASPEPTVEKHTRACPWQPEIHPDPTL